MPTTKMSARLAAWIGHAWVNGSVLATYGLGAALLITQTWLFDLLGAWSLLLIIGVLVGPWLIWSVQVTHWRLWAYRRVADVDALKAEAIALSVIWPSGHLFERTEFRTRSQALELQRLEQQTVRD
jgi:ABC-type transport system involved in Fe-S cluster assembly fused permease/ATPase subunit